MARSNAGTTPRRMEVVALAGAAGNLAGDEEGGRPWYGFDEDEAAAGFAGQALHGCVPGDATSKVTVQCVKRASWATTTISPAATSSCPSGATSYGGGEAKGTVGGGGPAHQRGVEEGSVL